MLLPVSVYLIPLFDFITVPLSLPLHLYFAVWRTRCSCPCLPLWELSCTAYMAAFLYLRGLYMWLSFLCLSCFYLSFTCCFSPLNPFLATMSFEGYFHVSFLLSSFFPVRFFFFFSPTVFVPGLFWCNFLNRVTTAGFVADQLIM